jgi:tripartite-type tricarboxylate transporter receptor subunit TctC
MDVATREESTMMKSLIAIAWLASLAISGPAWAQAYPNRPITMVVPFPAGGTTDTVARVLVEPMRATLGQPVIIENVGGAGGSIGVGRVARAAADGYTLSIGQWGSHVGNGAMFALSYDLLNDFAPISLIVSTPLWIVTRKDFPANDLKELIAWLKANPDKAAAGTIGPGSPGHLCGVYFQKTTDTRFRLVPYRGGNLAMQDLIGGHIDMQCSIASNSLPHVKNGNLKAIAVMAKQRWFGSPNTPTVDEMGVPGLHLSLWHGLWAPKGTPRDVIMKLNTAVVNTLANPAVRKAFTDAGDEIPAREQQTPEALGAHHKAEIEKWWPIIKAANIKAE